MTRRRSLRMPCRRTSLRSVRRAPLALHRKLTDPHSLFFSSMRVFPSPFCSPSSLTSRAATSRPLSAVFRRSTSPARRAGVPSRRRAFLRPRRTSRLSRMSSPRSASRRQAKSSSLLVFRLVRLETDLSICPSTGLRQTQSFSQISSSRIWALEVLTLSLAPSSVARSPRAFSLRRLSKSLVSSM